MTSQLYKNLSKVSKDKADREGRHVGEKVYATKKAADDARRSSNPGKGKSTPRPKAKGPSGPRRVTEQVVIETVISNTVNTSTKHSVSVDLNGPDRHARLIALDDRHPVVLGARAELTFPFVPGCDGRWSVCTLKALSTGTKGPEDTVAVTGNIPFDHVRYQDKWVGFPNIKQVKYMTDVDGNSLVKTDDVRILLVAIRNSGMESANICVKIHLTVQLDLVASTPSTSSI